MHRTDIFRKFVNVHLLLRISFAVYIAICGDFYTSRQIVKVVQWLLFSCGQFWCFHKPLTPKPENYNKDVLRTLFAELMFKAESMVKHWFLRKWTTIESNKVSLRRLKVSVEKECFVLVVLSIMSTSLTHFALHWNTLKELDSAPKEFSYGRTRRSQQICWFWTDLERSRLFFPCWCCFYSIIEAHSQIKQHCKKEGGMQRVTSILSEDVGLGEVLGLARECFVSSVQRPPKSWHLRGTHLLQSYLIAIYSRE